MRPNVLIIMTDQQYAGAMSCAGNAELRTPAMDGIAETGVRFENAYCTYPLCIPARESFLTGRMPFELGYREWGDAIDPKYEAQQLGFLFRDAGYTCVYGGKVHAPTNDPTAHGFRSICRQNDNQLAKACTDFLQEKHDAPLPVDMMTLDGTLWVEDGVPYMVYCHEWVQIKDGTIEYIQLTDDLSETVGEPMHLFNSSDATWNRSSPTYHCYVTDGPYLYTSKSGKLFMIWSSFSETGYTVGLAVSLSGKLAGPWEQQDEPLNKDGGGHGMLFTTFDGKLMLVYHAPNNRDAQPRIFELEDTGETLKVVKAFTGEME